MYLSTPEKQQRAEWGRLNVVKLHSTMEDAYDRSVNIINSSSSRVVNNNIFKCSRGSGIATTSSNHCYPPNTHLHVYNNNRI
mmetsp:Transcript_4228/g.3448  ORF Transcript_4228/g.3448 Transcript_4228/m.3448 type:complete len:82 (-) Transcript_4228:25-270(-)